MSQTCPSCQQPVSGRFCSNCGAAVSAECRECGKPLPPGARFCNHCGATAASQPAAAEAAPSRTPWWLPWSVAGVMALALCFTLLYRQADEPAPLASGSTRTAGAPLAGGAAAPTSGSAVNGPAPAGNPGAVDLNSMSPREAADRLFNRVMQNVSAGDTAQARAFLPMAISAYGRVPDLDDDGRYHLAVLHLVGRDPRAALAESSSILSRNPQHLFALFTAAQAEQGLGNAPRARELYRRFLSVYDAESRRDLPEYRDHAQALGPMRDEAQRMVTADT